MCHRADTEFLSTLSLRRATIFALWMEASHLLFLSTLSLRRATCYSFRHSASCRHFYPRSPCGERLVLVSMICLLRDFYPRSPCGERQDTRLTVADVYKISIHALLAESDLLYHFCPVDHQHFYPRSPCGERPPRCRQHLRGRRFLSTLSLRRATAHDAKGPGRVFHFYPRSPCGERPSKKYPVILGRVISIHALLAESDHDWPPVRDIIQWISIHALLAESDCNFSQKRHPLTISIHALLAESDSFRSGY